MPLNGAVISQPTYTIQGYEELLRIVMEEEELANAGSKEKRHQL